MAIIKNYGFLWERKYIFRGAGKALGHLKGISAGKPNADFREQLGVYALYDRNQQIVYVGQAGNGNADLFSRLKQHMDSKNLWNRWDYFSWVGFRDVNKDGTLSTAQSVDSQVSNYRYSNALDEIEGVLIELIEPKLNKQGGKLKGATEYRQYIDNRVQEITTYELLEAIKSINK